MTPTAIWITGSYDDLADELGPETQFVNCGRDDATHISVHLLDNDECEPVQDFPLGNDPAKAYVDALLLASQLAEQHQVRIRDTYQKHNFQPKVEMVRGHKHTCANVQPGSTAADVCDCGAVVDGKSVPAEKPLRVSDRMYHAFVEATRLAGNESETVKDLVMNGLEAALDVYVPADPLKAARKAMLLKHAELIKERDKLRLLLREAIKHAPLEINLPAWLEMQAEVEKILPCVDEGCPQAGSEHVCVSGEEVNPLLIVQPGMPRQRYHELQHGDGTLTPEEIAAGWFFDDDYDGLLAHTSWVGHEKDRP